MQDMFEKVPRAVGVESVSNALAMKGEVTAKVLADAAKKKVNTYTRRRAVSTGSERVSTASRIFSTAEESVSTAGESMPVSTADVV
nr:hypothetical protein [Tanacetum cinerariifolium]